MIAVSTPRRRWVGATVTQVMPAHGTTAPGTVSVAAVDARRGDDPVAVPQAQRPVQLGDRRGSVQVRAGRRLAEGADHGPEEGRPLLGGRRAQVGSGMVGHGQMSTGRRRHPATEFSRAGRPASPSPGGAGPRPGCRPSFAKMCWVCFSTAPGVTTRMRAIAVFECPSAIRPSTSRSRGVSRRTGSSARRRANSCATTCGSSTVPPPTTSSSAVEERVDVGHPVLEQVADAAGAVGEQLVGVGHLDVLREHQHRRPGHRLPRLDGGPQPLVGVRRRHPDVDDGDVRAVLAHRPDERGAVADRGDHLGAGLLEQPDQALAEEDRVLGQDSPARQLRREPRRDRRGGCPRSARRRPRAAGRPSPARPCPGASTAPPLPSSSTTTRSRPSVQPDLDPAGGGVAVLGHVGQRLADDEVGGVLGDRGQPLGGQVDGQVDRDGERAAIAARAAARPRSARTGGAMPRDRARSSSSVSRARPAASPSVARAASGSRSSCRWARARSMSSRTSCCCGPSWMSRSSRRSATASAATAALRPSVSRPSSAWRGRPGGEQRPPELRPAAGRPRGRRSGRRTAKTSADDGVEQDPPAGRALEAEQLEQVLVVGVGEASGSAQSHAP